MKSILIRLFILCCAQYSLHASANQFEKNMNAEGENEILDFYRQYSSYTDPGEYAYLYENLPDSLPELCSLVRSQFIHAYADLACILGTDYPITQYPPILDFIFEDDKQMPVEHIPMLNRICELMKSIDAENLSDLRDIYNNNPELQMTKSFKYISEN